MVCDIVISNDVSRLLKRTENNEQTNSRISKARSRAEEVLYSLKSQLNDLNPSSETENALKQVRMLLARVSRTTTFATIESTEKLMKDIEKLEASTKSLIGERRPSISRNTPRSSTEYKPSIIGSLSATQTTRDYELNNAEFRKSITGKVSLGSDHGAMNTIPLFSPQQIGVGQPNVVSSLGGITTSGYSGTVEGPLKRGPDVLRDPSTVSLLPPPYFPSSPTQLGTIPTSVVCSSTPMAPVSSPQSPPQPPSLPPTKEVKVNSSQGIMMNPLKDDSPNSSPSMQSPVGSPRRLMPSGISSFPNSIPAPIPKQSSLPPPVTSLSEYKDYSARGSYRESISTVSAIRGGTESHTTSVVITNTQTPMQRSSSPHQSYSQSNIGDSAVTRSGSASNPLARPGSPSQYPSCPPPPPPPQGRRGHPPTSSHQTSQPEKGEKEAIDDGSPDPLSPTPQDHSQSNIGDSAVTRSGSANYPLARAHSPPLPPGSPSQHPSCPPPPPPPQGRRGHPPTSSHQTSQPEKGEKEAIDDESPDPLEKNITSSIPLRSIGVVLSEKEAKKYDDTQKRQVIHSCPESGNPTDKKSKTQETSLPLTSQPSREPCNPIDSKSRIIPSASQMGPPSPAPSTSSSVSRTPPSVPTEVHPSIPNHPVLTEVHPSIPTPPPVPTEVPSSIPTPPVPTEVPSSIPTPPPVPTEVHPSSPNHSVLTEVHPSIPNHPPVPTEVPSSIPTPPPVPTEVHPSIPNHPVPSSDSSTIASSTFPTCSVDTSGEGNKVSKHKVSVLGPNSSNMKKTLQPKEIPEKQISEEAQSPEREIQQPSTEKPSLDQSSAIEQDSYVKEQTQVEQSQAVEQLSAEKSPVLEQPSVVKPLVMEQPSVEDHMMIPPEEICDKDMEQQKKQDEMIRQSCACCRRQR